jgi:hypothetical protein
LDFAAVYPKGAPGRESRLWTRLVSPAQGHEKKWSSQYGQKFDLRNAI